MVILYSEKDMNDMKNNIDDIVLKAIRKQLDYLEPSIEEYKKVYQLVINYIKMKKLIICSNFAIDKLIKAKNYNDGYFLKIEDDILLNPNRPSDYPVIDIYSHDPHNTMKELCDKLNEENLIMVEGQSGRDYGSYKVFVNLLQYIGIKYMPKNIFENVDKIKIDGLYYLHPNLLLIDNLKISTSLLINNKLLKDYILTTKKLIKYYPFDVDSNGLIKNKINKNINDTLDFIRKIILPKSELIVFGYYAYYYYLSKENNDKNNLYIPYFEVMSNNFKLNIDTITKKLKKFNKNITIQNYYPFFNYLGYCTSFSLNGHVILYVYNQDNQCIQYNYIEKKKIYICSYQSFIMTSLINNLKFKISKNYDESKNQMFMIKNIVDIRNKYLKKNKKTLLDNSPFQEFNVECKGNTITNDRKYRLYVNEKIKKREPFILKYNPENPKKYNPKMYKLNNISGDIIQ